MPLGLVGRAADRAQALERVGDVRAQLGDHDADRRAHRLVGGIAQVDRDARRQRPLGEPRVLGQIAAQRRAAQIQDEVVERAPEGRRDPLHALELVLLGREAPLTPDPSAKRRVGRPVGSLQRAVIDRGEGEIERRPREPAGCRSSLPEQPQRKAQRSARPVRLRRGRALAGSHGPERRRAAVGGIAGQGADDQCRIALTPSTREW